VDCGPENTAAVVLLTTAVICLLLLKYGRADGLDSWWLQVRFTLREKLFPKTEPDPDIVLVLIDDRRSKNGMNRFVAWGPSYRRCA